MVQTPLLIISASLLG